MSTNHALKEKFFGYRFKILALPPPIIVSKIVYYDLIY